MIRACDNHGYFAGESCPECDAAGADVLGDDRRVRLSKFASGALRHFPDDAGLSPDGHGWVDYDALVDAVTRKYSWAEREHVDGVVATDPKGRFERRSSRIRAAYGHSIDVTLEPTESAVPSQLYHGTARRNIESIRETGLRPMGRQRVHLSTTREEARTVGRRHDDDPVVVVVDADAMVANGFGVDERGPETYTVDHVPPRYLSVESRPE
ncbi:putative RNA 2'-phosphotransferase [Halogranum amylolyticum]|uniref:Probable RNA 2'-phosphotransferase n=1 Tax=Halogranum amylolyticum TaxID=660520 RepID=A0A1H8US69_9EURY|nr:RNA 2'-phosphotransferase [Halogranum amylolyticum]SEP06055.1 putative RNA 2'-phosphotransferase [Halogranum amylolyticum]